MIEQQVKVHFAQLPFITEIPYIKINDAKSIDLNKQCGIKSEDNYVCPSQISIMNNDNSLIHNPWHKSRNKKAIVKMNENAQNFQYLFYQIFTTRKKFQKKFVIMIHNAICCHLNLRRVNRDETRSIDLYFQHFADHAEKILVYIKDYKREIINRLPELRRIMY